MGKSRRMNSAIVSPCSVWMAQALDLAKEGMYRTSPNPRVGCVLLDASGNLIGRGSTQLAGEAHAEIMALRDAKANGYETDGATAYVTLEPCSHHGRTGPCCDALVEAGVSRVVASIADPNPQVAGRGFERLRAAGVQVEVGDGEKTARELNIGFFSRMVRKRPWVRMKSAVSMDGFTALVSGESQWITGRQARADGHAWRARSCAVLTGIGTVLADDPHLNVRAVQTPRQPMLVIVDSQLRTPLNAALFDISRRIVIYTASRDKTKSEQLAKRGAEVRWAGDAVGKVNLSAALADLAQQGVNETHVEAGAILNGALLESGCVDELLMYVAPKLLGLGLNVAQMHSITQLQEAMCFDYTSIELVGTDVRLVARRRDSAAF